MAQNMLNSTRAREERETAWMTERILVKPFIKKNKIIARDQKSRGVVLRGRGG